MNIKNGSVFILLVIITLKSNAQFINVNNYENKAQAYAILSAQFSKEAYFFAKKIDVSTSYAAIKNNADTGFVFTQLALEYADSALLVASTNATNAINIMLRAKNYQLEAQNGYGNTKNAAQKLKKRKDVDVLLYALGNAVDDAYLASLLFENTALDSLETAPVVEDKPRNVSRLETDEVSFMSLKEIYGVRIVEIEDEIIELEIRSKNSSGNELVALNNAIDQLKNEKKSFLAIMKNSNDKLISIRNELSEEMLKVVEAAIFSTKKEGFYNENVPIPLNAELPAGLVYKIQIGFFKNQIPQQHFDGIFPLASEQVDAVYFRYTAGNFPVYNDAKKAQESILTKGYKDAFIVAYFNGKKISISEALSKEIK